MRTSMRFSTRFLSNLAFVSMLIALCARAEDVVEETTVDDAGIVETCGEGGGLDPCRDADGETYQHADDPNFIKLDSTQQLEKSSQQIRNESPKQLDKTIEQIEDDEKN